jgi:CTP:molybdopterin cytidylyltransferase MocA
MTTAAAILAAGSGTRFVDGHKLRAALRGRAIVCWSVNAAVQAALDQTIVITGATPIDDLVPGDVTVVHNPDWSDGIATSLAAAVETARANGHDAVVVGLGDQPFISPEAWRALARQVDRPIAVATYDGRRGNPVRLDRAVWDLLPTTGDEGARRLMAERPELVAEIACAGNPLDIDTQEELARWS